MPFCFLKNYLYLCIYDTYKWLRIKFITLYTFSFCAEFHSATLLFKVSFFWIMGCGVIGNTKDFGSFIPDSNSGSPTDVKFYTCTITRCFGAPSTRFKRSPVFDTYNTKMQLSMLVRIQLLGSLPEWWKWYTHNFIKYQIYLKTKIVRR